MKLRAVFLSLTFLAFSLFASTASAVELSFQGATSATIAPGGTFTISVGLDNVSTDNTPGFEGFLTGLAAAGADVVTGQAASNYLCGFVFAGTGCLNGVASVNNAFYNPNDLSAHFTLGQDSLFTINVAGATFSAADGSLDLGIANDVAGGTHDPVDAVVTFTANTVGVHTITLTGNFSDGVNVLPITSSTFTLTVPEPGAIAASMAALGTVFAVVGVRRRR